MAFSLLVEMINIRLRSHHDNNGQPRSQ
jgi:hypothetical protein